jgi:hypothetical protein
VEETPRFKIIKIKIKIKILCSLLYFSEKWLLGSLGLLCSRVSG